jgi:hypothetical protein
LSQEERWRIVLAWKRHKSINKVSRLLGYTRVCVRRWVDRYNCTGCVYASPNRGRKPALSPTAGDAAYELMLGGRHLVAKDTAVELHCMGLVDYVVDKRTIITHLMHAAVRKGARVHFRRGRPRIGLTQATKSKRLAFAEANKARHWDIVLFSDRKKFVFKWPGSCVAQSGTWEVVGGEIEGVHQPTHPQVLNVYAAFCGRGVTNVHVVAGTSKYKHSHCNKKGKPAKNITTSQYVEVLQHTFLPQGQRLLAGKPSWVLQQDGDPTHKVASKVLDDWNKKHRKQVELLRNWPPNSPDLNPIENIWAYVQRLVYKKGYTTFDAFRSGVIQELESIPQSMLHNLIKSMPKRMAEVIEKGGGKTRY